jgi:hypothetical protein
MGGSQVRILSSAGTRQKMRFDEVVSQARGDLQLLGCYTDQAA